MKRIRSRRRVRAMAARVDLLATRRGVAVPTTWQPSRPTTVPPVRPAQADHDARAAS